MTAPAVLPPLPPPVDELGHVLIELAEVLSRSWVLVGDQMVLLHCLEHGREPSQVSQDGDIVANIRAEPNAVSTIVAALESRRFTVDGMSPDLIAHWYVRAGGDVSVKIDVLAPEGIGPGLGCEQRDPGPQQRHERQDRGQPRNRLGGRPSARLPIALEESTALPEARRRLHPRADLHAGDRGPHA